MRRATLTAWLAGVLLGSACGGGAETTPRAVQASAEVEIEATTTPTARPPSSTEPLPPTSDPADHVAPQGWKIRQQLPVDTVLLGGDGVSIEVTITGGPRLEPTDPCGRNYQLHLAEAETEARLSLFELEPSNPEPGPDGSICTSEGHGWRLEAELGDPLGQRVLIDDLNGVPATIVDLGTVLQPTDGPPGWVSHPPVARRGRLEWYFSDPNGGAAFLYLASSPVGSSGLDPIRSRDLVRIEEITVRAEPGIRVTSLEDGAVTLAWEEGRHLYEVHGYLVDPLELERIAEGLKRDSPEHS